MNRPTYAKATAAKRQDVHVVADPERSSWHGNEGPSRDAEH